MYFYFLRGQLWSLPALPEEHRKSTGLDYAYKVNCLLFCVMGTHCIRVISFFYYPDN